MQNTNSKPINSHVGNAKNVLLFFSVLFLSFIVFHNNLGHSHRDFITQDGHHIPVLKTLLTENTQVREDLPNISFQLFALNNEKIEPLVVEPEVKDDDNLKSYFLFNPVYSFISKVGIASTCSVITKSQQHRTSVQLYILFHAWKGFVA